MSVRAYPYRKTIHIMTEKACEYGRRVYEKSQEVGIFIQQHGQDAIHHLRSFARSTRDNHPTIYNYAVKILLGTALCTLVWNNPFPFAHSFTTNIGITASILKGPIHIIRMFLLKIIFAAEARTSILRYPLTLSYLVQSIHSLVAQRNIKKAVKNALICIGLYFCMHYIFIVYYLRNINELERPITLCPHRFTQAINFLLKSIAVIEIVALPFFLSHPSFIRSMFSLSGKVVGTYAGVDSLVQTFLLKWPELYAPYVAKKDAQFIKKALEQLQTTIVQDAQGNDRTQLDHEYALFSENNAVSFDEDLEASDTSIFLFLPRVFLFYLLSQLHKNKKAKLYIPGFITQPKQDQKKILEEQWKKIQNQFLQLNQDRQAIILDHILNNTPVTSNDSTVKDLITDIRTLASSLCQGNIFFNQAFSQFQKS